MSISDDTDLVRRALSGDESAFAELVRLYQDVVARTVYRITRRTDWVEDLTQEVFLKAFEGLRRFRRRSGFSTWLYRIAVNTSLDALRKAGTDRKVCETVFSDRSGLNWPLISGENRDGEKIVLDREMQSQVKTAIAELPPETRTILVLRYLEELSVSEVAAVMQIPEGTARSRLYYARLELARLLKPYLQAAPARTEDKEH
ncbi:MAG: sigma-70 family RNA polymerase sigma factor [bacterium]